MIAKLEKQIPVDIGQTLFCKYRNLQNLAHWHLEHEIVYVLRGRAELNVNNVICTLTSGMCAFIEGGEIHCIKGSDDNITQVIKTSSSVIDKITENKHLESTILKNSYIVDAAFKEIEKEFKSTKEYKDIVVDCLTIRLITEIFRIEDTYIKSQTQMNNIKNIELLRWISKNCMHINFKDAVKHFNLSYSYFSRYFQNLVGMKFTQYLNILKVALAIEKIRNGEKNMTDISISCGFGTIRNFNRVFKNIAGYAPTQLPENYVFPYTISPSDNDGFDPTLSCSKIVE